MAKKITVRAIASFEGVRKGDMAEVELTPRIKAILDIGYLERVDTVGTPGDRQSPDQSSISGSRSPGANDRIEVGNEPSEDPDAG